MFQYLRKAFALAAFVAVSAVLFGAPAQAKQAVDAGKNLKPSLTCVVLKHGIVFKGKSGETYKATCRHPDGVWRPAVSVR